MHPLIAGMSCSTGQMDKTRAVQQSGGQNEALIAESSCPEGPAELMPRLFVQLS